MKRAEAVQVLTECAAELRTRLGVSELSLFGSVARDDARDDSDVDVMVSFFSTPSFPSFMELKDYLEQRLGTRVDLVTRAGLKARVRPFVEREVLGEAAKRVPDALRAEMPEVPWRAIAGFRDFVAHVYFALDDAIVWGAALDEVPKLRAAVTRFLARTQTA